MENDETCRIVTELRNYQGWMTDGLHGKPSIGIDDIGEETFRRGANEIDRLKEINAQLLGALDAAETMLRVMPEMTSSAGGTKLMMKTEVALGLVRCAIAKGERHD